MTMINKYHLHDTFSFLLRLLAPITPHICHNLWQQLWFEKIIIDASWPRVDKSALKTEEVEFVVQVNGKLRAQFSASGDSSEDTLVAVAKEKIASFITGKEIKKTIVVGHRQLINFVVSE